jgi:hypothetical protein
LPRAACVGHGSERDGQSQNLLASLPLHLAGEREGAQDRRLPPRVGSPTVWDI